jgi:hypothetical protein
VDIDTEDDWAVAELLMALPGHSGPDSEPRV